MNNAETFSLKWNEFEDNILGAWSSLRQEQEYCDVTLACDDGSLIEAHKMILSAGSPLFRDILKKSKHPSPFIYLKGINKAILNNVLDFLYNGQANIPQEELNTFLETAHELQVKGLQNKQENGLNQKPTFENQFYESEQSNIKQEEGNIAPVFDKEQLSEASENDFVNNLEHNVIEVSTNDELDAQIEQGINRTGGLCECNTCGKLSKRKDVIKKHVETHIEGISHSCQICNKTFATRNSLQVHIIRNHSQQIFDCDICGKVGMNKMAFNGHKQTHQY